MNLFFLGGGDKESSGAQGVFFLGEFWKCQSDRIDVQIGKYDSYWEEMADSLPSHPQKQGTAQGYKLRKFKKEQKIKQVGLVSTRDTQIPCQNGFFTMKNAMVLRFVIWRHLQNFLGLPWIMLIREGFRNPKFTTNKNFSQAPKGRSTLTLSSWGDDLRKKSPVIQDWQWCIGFFYRQFFLGRNYSVP